MHQTLIMGAGAVTRRAAQSLIDDHWESIDTTDKHIILVINSSHDEDVEPVTEHIARWAMSNEVPYEVMVRESVLEADNGPFVTKILDNAHILHATKSPVSSAVRRLSKTDDLFIAWADEDTRCQRALLAMARQGYPIARDLTNALAEIEVAFDSVPEADTDTTPEASDMSHPEVSDAREAPDVILIDALYELIEAFNTAVESFATRVNKKVRAGANA